MNEFQGKSVQVVCENVIDTPVGKVFPLACPVAEYKWIDGWKCELIHCPNDRVELGTVFTEIYSAPFLTGTGKGKTTWTAVLHDPKKYKLHFQLDNSVSSSLYQIEMKALPDEMTLCRLTLTYHALNSVGNTIIENNGERKIFLMLSYLSKMLKCYAETGTMLKSASMIKQVLHNKQLTHMDKLRLTLNKLAMLRMKDVNRKRLLTMNR